MKFEYAKITRSRLMGSMGLIIKRVKDEDEIYEYYLLDSEGLGLCDYVRLENPTQERAYREEERLMGGFGEDRVYISEDRALFLVKYYGNKTIEYGKELPEGQENFINIIKNYKTDITMDEMFPIISRKIEDDIEFINFMTMRFIAWDREGLRYFCENEEISNMHITEINGTLLKNTVIKKSDEKYLSKVIYEDIDGYYTCSIAFNISKNNGEFKIKSLVFGNKEMMYDFEVFNEISKNEFIDIYELNNSTIFAKKLYEDNPFMLRSYLEEGIFFTRFKFNNNHVKEKVYVINNDLKAIYYIMDDKLFVGTYSKKDRDYINKILLLNYKEFIEFEDAMCLEQNALYDFAESGCEDFYYFIED